MRSSVLVLLLLGACPTWASGFGTVLKNFTANPTTTEETAWYLYVKGVAEGFLWYGAVTTEDSERKYGDSYSVYCPPPKLALTPENFVDIGEDYLAKNPEAFDDHFGLRMIMALREVFPCR